MSTTTAIVPRTVSEAEQLSSLLSKSALIADALRGKPADVLACILTGAELGLPPMAAAKAVVMIKGKATLSAQALVAVALSHPSCIYIRCVESTEQIATYEAMRKGYPEPATLSWTMAQAQKAGLGGDNWRKYGAEMLRARCQAAIVRMVFPDATLGMLATEELTDAPAGEHEVDAVRVDAERATPSLPPTAPKGLPAAQPSAAPVRDDDPPHPEREPGEDDGDEPTDPDEKAAAARLAMMAELSEKISGAMTVENLKEMGKALKEISKQLAEPEVEAMREIYGKRLAELSKAKLEGKATEGKAGAGVSP